MAPKKKVKYVCGKCGSSGITFRVDAYWAQDTQRYEITDEPNYREDSYCMKCNDMANAREELIDEEVYYVVFDLEHKLYLHLPSNAYNARVKSTIRLVASGTKDEMIGMWHAVVNERRITINNVLDTFKEGIR